MSELIRWSGGGGIAFFVSASEIRGFKDFSLTTSSETEDKTANKEKYSTFKNAGSYSITMTAVLNAALGVDVKETALAMSEAARTGESGYFYTAGEKLFPSMFMATEAKISNIVMAGNGAWVSCEVSWTLKQCEKYGGGAGGSSSSGSGKSGSGSGSSSKSSSVKTQAQLEVQQARETMKGATVSNITSATAQAGAKVAAMNLVVAQQLNTLAANAAAQSKAASQASAKAKLNIVGRNMSTTIPSNIR